jgi:hypothetical protein
MKYKEFKNVSSPKPFEYTFDKPCICSNDTNRCRRWYEEKTKTMIQVVDCSQCLLDESFAKGFDLVEVIHK